MRKFYVVFAILLVLSGALTAQIDLTEFESDMGALLGSIGRDVAPSLQLNALSADMEGAAYNTGFTIALLPLGLTVGNGIATIIAPGAYDWEFDLLGMGDLIAGFITPELAPWVTAVQNVFPYPIFKAMLGFTLPWKLDLTLFGSIIWKDEINGILGLIPDIPAEVTGKIDALGLDVSMLNIGAKIRRSLLSDYGAYPGISVGLGYAFLGNDLGVELTSLSSFMEEPIELGPGTTLDMRGEISFATRAHTFGVELNISKKLAIFRPYARLGGWYQITSFEALTNLTAEIDDGDPITENTTEGINVNPVVAINSASALATLGYEFVLGPFIFNTNMMFDLGSVLIDLEPLTLDGVAGGGFSLNLGGRIQVK